ncbi:MAG: HAD family hydrolase [Oscillospiraceae bacterium]|nr:HAD family hydrolase [Oscillospiraceae bacterium]
MTQKLIFLDIDGTLVEPGTNVPPASALEAVRGAQKNGHLIFLCSGRNYGMLSPLLRYGFDGLVASAGGYIEAAGRVVYDCPMTAAQQEKVMRVFQENGVYRTVESRDSSYTDESFRRFLTESGGRNSELLRWREQLENNLGIRPMAEYRGEPVYKVVFMSPDMQRLETPRQELEDEFQFCVQEADQYGIVNGELINRQFDKGQAVKRLSGVLGIPLADTIAFGDSMNDLEMLQTAGLGICMGNGSDALKAAAAEVCPPLKEDGLYRAFDAHGLL